MRPVTGRTNPTVQTDKMSIRLWSDGHSFPREALLEARQMGDRVVEVELLTPRSTLVPAPCFDPDEASKLLQAAGLAERETEAVVWSEPLEEQVVVMAIDRAVLPLLPATVHYTSPLLTLHSAAPHTICLARYEDLLYIKVWDEELRLAEVLQVASDADLIYYVARLGEWLPLRNYELQVEGDRPGAVRKMVKKYFK